MGSGVRGVGGAVPGSVQYRVCGVGGTVPRSVQYRARACEEEQSLVTLNEGGVTRSHKVWVANFVQFPEHGPQGNPFEPL